MKQLDLSRNALLSLEGLEHLNSLETLNLYYNCVPNLKELFRLRHNVNLKDLDLRLNPVTKDEPDYRLFIIHMLVNLRKLDDRPVKESERKAALMHFDTDQAYEMAQDVQPPQVHNEVDRDTLQNAAGMTLPHHVQSRKDLVRSLAPHPSDSTTKLMEVLNERDRALWEKGPSTSSRENSGSPTLKRTNEGNVRNLKGLIGSPLRASSEVDYSGEVHKPQTKATFTPHPRPPSPSHHHPHSPSPLSQVQNSEKGPFYHLSPGNVDVGSGRYTAAARHAEALVKVMERHVTLSMEVKSELQRELAQWFTHNIQGSDTPLYTQMSLEELQRLQEMVHTRESELAMKNDLLSQQEEEISEMRKHLEELLHQVDQKEHERRSDLSRKRQLEQAEKDLMTVQKHVHKLQTENSHLLLKLEEQRSQTNVHELQEEIATAKQENACLRIELQKVAQQCQVDEEASNQMRKVVSMLQESHQSLVSTNSHLMHELQESKQRHAREIEQMHLNYEHLRKTVDIIHRT